MKYLLAFLVWTMPVVASLSNAGVFGPTNGSVSDADRRRRLRFRDLGTDLLARRRVRNLAMPGSQQRPRTAADTATDSLWLCPYLVMDDRVLAAMVLAVTDDHLVEPGLHPGCCLAGLPDGTSCPWTVVAMAASFVARGLDFAGCASQCGASHRGVSPAVGQQNAAVDVAAVGTDRATGSNHGRTPAGQSLVHPGGALGSCRCLRQAARIGSRWCGHRRRGRHGTRRRRGAAVSVAALATAGALQTHQLLRRLS